MEDGLKIGDLSRYLFEIRQLVGDSLWPEVDNALAHALENTSHSCTYLARSLRNSIWGRTRNAAISETIQEWRKDRESLVLNKLRSLKK